MRLQVIALRSGSSYPHLSRGTKLVDPTPESSMTDTIVRPITQLIAYLIGEEKLVGCVVTHKLIDPCTESVLR